MVHGVLLQGVHILGMVLPLPLRAHVERFAQLAPNVQGNQVRKGCPIDALPAIDGMPAASLFFLGPETVPHFDDESGIPHSGILSSGFQSGHEWQKESMGGCQLAAFHRCRAVEGDYHQVLPAKHFDPGRNEKEPNRHCLQLPVRRDVQRNSTFTQPWHRFDRHHQVPFSCDGNHGGRDGRNFLSSRIASWNQTSISRIPIVERAAHRIDRAHPDRTELFRHAVQVPQHDPSNASDAKSTVCASSRRQRARKIVVRELAHDA
mmetsp:Transcript_18506/g.52904  ORF Transcript_18506/g.52904 Transcript_18506/m.52904 type:complete len:262 (+) Transcript_18506:599-1384(+)